MLLEDVGDEPGKLPLLSHALRASFERRQGPQLTVEDYISVGRVKGAVSDTAEEAYANLDEEQKKVAKSIFMLCTVGGGRVPYTRRPLPRSDFDPECFPGADAVLYHLAAARLLTLAKDRSEEQIVEIAHEALIRFWTRLETWLEDNSAQQELRQDLITRGREVAQVRTFPRLALPRSQPGRSPQAPDRSLTHPAAAHRARVPRRQPGRGETPVTPVPVAGGRARRHPRAGRWGGGGGCLPAWPEECSAAHRSRPPASGHLKSPAGHEPSTLSAPGGGGIPLGPGSSDAGGLVPGGDIQPRARPLPAGGQLSIGDWRSVWRQVGDGRNERRQSGAVERDRRPRSHDR